MSDVVERLNPALEAGTYATPVKVASELTFFAAGYGGEAVHTLRQRGTWTHAFASVQPWVAMGGTTQLRLYDLDRGIPNRLVSRDDGGLPNVTNPVWSPADSLQAFGTCGLGVVRISDLVTSPLVEAGPRGERFAVRLTASGTSAVLVQNWPTRLH